MSYELPELPYAKDALSPHISAETLEYHHGKHHAAYTNKLNAMLPGSGFEEASLDDIIKKADGGLFNQAAQYFNHSFYWKCLSPNGGGAPKGAIAEAINESFGSFDAFKDAFTKAAGGHFGSGWAWLVKNADGKLEVTSTHDAGCPIRDGAKPILTCDVWEHAYYIDYRNARPKYIEAFWNLVNWDFANENL